MCFLGRIKDNSSLWKFVLLNVSISVFLNGSVDGAHCSGEVKRSLMSASQHSRSHRDASSIPITALSFFSWSSTVGAHRCGHCQPVSKYKEKKWFKESKQKTKKHLGQSNHTKKRKPGFLTLSSNKLSVIISRKRCASFFYHAVQRMDD